jgi:hypothetical protein
METAPDVTALIQSDGTVEVRLHKYAGAQAQFRYDKRLLVPSVYFYTYLAAAVDDFFDPSGQMKVASIV